MASKLSYLVFIDKLLPRLSSCLCVINTYRSLLFTLLPLSFGVHTHTIYWFTFLLMSCPHKYLNYVTTTISARHAFDLFLLLLTIQLSVAQPTPVCVIESIPCSSVSTMQACWVNLPSYFRYSVPTHQCIYFFSFFSTFSINFMISDI